MKFYYAYLLVLAFMVTGVWCYDFWASDESKTLFGYEPYSLNDAASSNFQANKDSVEIARKDIEQDNKSSENFYDYIFCFFRLMYL